MSQSDNQFGPVEKTSVLPQGHIASPSQSTGPFYFDTKCRRPGAIGHRLLIGEQGLVDPNAGSVRDVMPKVSTQGHPLRWRGAGRGNRPALSFIQRGSSVGQSSRLISDRPSVQVRPSLFYFYALMVGAGGGKGRRSWGKVGMRDNATK